MKTNRSDNNIESPSIEIKSMATGFLKSLNLKSIFKGKKRDTLSDYKPSSNDSSKSITSLLIQK